MSKINDLIKKLCPNGVEFKPLREVCIKVQDGNYGKNYPKINELKSEGIALINGKAIHGKIVKEAVDYISEEKNEQMKKARIYTDDVLFLNRGNIGETAMVTEKYNNCNIGPQVTLLRANQDFIRPKFLKHILHSKHVRKIINTFTGSTIRFVSVEPMRDMIIPVPPLEVQDEIVRILDKFDELEANLEAELEARKSQYEFWRGKVISSSDGRNGKLIELLSGPVTDGPHTTPQFVSEGIPFISASAVHEGKIHLEDAQGFITKEFDAECSKKYKPKKWDVYMVKSGSTTGKVAIVDIDDDFNIWSPLAAMRTNNEITSRYLYQLLQTKEIQEQVQNRMSHGSQPNLSMRVLEQFDVKIPTLKEQERIVNVLDKFDTLVNDITMGLPAEIELRRQQYEYYRNKLLSFEELNNE